MLPGQLNAFQTAEHQPFTLEHAADSPAVLLIHGFPGSPAEMRPLAQALHDAGWTARGMLLPGFGAQIETLPERTAREWLDAVRDEYTALRQHHKTVAVVGYSMGGALAITLAAQVDPKPKALVLLAPFWTLDGWLWKMLPALRILFPRPRLFRRMKLDFSKPEVREGIWNFMPGIDLDDPQVQHAIHDYPLPVNMLGQIHRAGRLAYRLAPQVTIAAQVIQGERDDLVHPARTSQLVRRLPHATYIIIPQADHALIDPMRMGWEQLRQTLITFLDDSPQRTSVKSTLSGSNL
jgi:carboxylesterase